MGLRKHRRGGHAAHRPEDKTTERVSHDWAGEFGDLQDAKRRLEIAVPLSLVLIIGLLYCLFNSLLECFLTLSGIPFAIAGGVLALYVSGLNFSISAAIGFVSLFGVSVINGILIITYYNQARLHRGTPMDSMFRAVRPG